MADWFRCRPTKLLRGLGGLSDDAQLAYTKALLLIYENDGKITHRQLAREFPQWRAKRLERAVAECIELDKLVGTAGGELHNDYAMHELQEIGDLSQTRAAAGQKGGRIKAQRERLARKIVERNRSPDLPMDLPENQPKTRQSGHKVATKLEQSSNSADIEMENDAELSNEINGAALATLQHSRAIDIDTELRDTPFSVPPTEIDEVLVIEGEIIEDAPRGRKQPMPPGWLPTHAALSERVQALVDHWSVDEFDEQATKFMEWAEAGDQRFVKWDRAFGNWCVKHHEQRRRTRHGRQSGWAGAAS